MAWTTEPTRAGWFANRWGADLEEDAFVATYGTEEQSAAEQERLALALARAAQTGEQMAHVYVATVEPAGVLAVMDELEPDGRGEAEVVVDPDHLPRPVRRVP